MMLVQDFLENAADRLPEKVALVCGSRRFTYADLDAMANRLSHALVEMGVRRGDRVVVHLDNTVEAVVAIFAALKAGAVFVVVNHTTKREKLVYILGNCAATALVLDARALRDASLADECREKVPSLKGMVLCGRGAEELAREHERWSPFESIQTRCPSDRPPRQNSGDDIACLIYTSGTTGDPKGVVSEHRNVVFASGSIIRYVENVEDDVIINVLPLSFDYGLYQLLMAFRVGGRLLLEKSFAFPAAILKKMVEERATGLPGVPTIFAILCRMDLSAFDLSSLRYLTNTAAALPPRHIEEIRQKFPDTRLYSMYGLTETKRTLYLPPEQLDRRPDSVGIPIPGTEAWVEDDAGRRAVPGEVGELVARGPHVMRGYWEAPEATAERFRLGPDPEGNLCYTGDLFRADEEGFFYFVGRKDDIIKSRGEKVAPKEVENVLYRLEGVLEAAVVGVPDPILGQAVKAIVVRRTDEVTENDVLAHCKSLLEDFMVPKHVEFRDELPKTTSGKVKRSVLR